MSDERDAHPRMRMRYHCHRRSFVGDDYRGAICRLGQNCIAVLRHSLVDGFLFLDGRPGRVRSCGYCRSLVRIFLGRRTYSHPEADSCSCRDLPSGFSFSALRLY